MENELQLVECPRDAMQGIGPFIATEKKIAYINALLKCGFHTLDCGSFVSPAAIPQMKDTSEVLDQLDQNHGTRLSVIIANRRGALDAAAHPRVDILGFPFSVSEEFQKRNTNTSREQAVDRVKEIQEICTDKGKQMLIYLSMAFGNPYDEPWHPDTVAEWMMKLAGYDIRLFMPSDTIGSSNPGTIAQVYGLLNTEFPDLDIGAHLHTTPNSWKEKLQAAWTSGCRRFDSALKGLGGCPMAKDGLTGNMPTENVLGFLDERGIGTGIDPMTWAEAMKLSTATFPAQDP